MNKEDFARLLGWPHDPQDIPEWEIIEFVNEHHPQFEHASLAEFVTAVADMECRCVDHRKLGDFIPVAISNAIHKGVKVQEQEGIYDRYHVIEGRCVNFRRKTIGEVHSYVMSHLPSWLTPDEYFGMSHNERKAPFPQAHWIACYYITGGSEGYYIHVDAIDDNGNRSLVFVGKTLLEGREGRQFCQNVVAKLSEILEV